MPKSETVALAVRDLRIQFQTPEGIVRAVNGVSFDLRAESVLGVVGESGSGKTVTALALLRLVPSPGRVVSGQIWHNGVDLLTLPDEQMRRLRGREIAMIFQDATAALNPTLTVGAQVEELIRSHTGASRKEARALAIAALRKVGLPDAERLAKQYPFALSGGMCQRVMIAMAMALDPTILIADEPTSGLDVTVQAQILAEMQRLRAEHQAALLLITHDLGVIAQMADEVAVMYAGHLIEYADVRSLFARPAHPYTVALMASIPRLDNRGGPLRQIRGTPPSLVNLPDRCPFLERCHRALSVCRTEPAPPLVEVAPGRQVACYNPVTQDFLVQV